MTLYDRLDGIQNRDAFLDFLEALAAERAEATVREIEQPRGVYDPPFNEWEASTLDDYLEAVAQYARAWLRSDQPSWRSLALTLLSARRGPVGLRHRRASVRRAQEPGQEIVLRLDETTARILHDLFYLVGEHIAAGAEIPRLPSDVNDRLGAIHSELGGQLGIPSIAMSMQRHLDEKRQREREAERGDNP